MVRIPYIRVPPPRILRPVGPSSRTRFNSWVWIRSQSSAAAAAAAGPPKTNATPESSKGGEIHTSSRQGILYFNNIYTIGETALGIKRLLSALVFRADFNFSTNYVTKVITDLKMPIVINEVVPQVRDGGAFLKYTVTDTSVTPGEISKRIEDYLLKHSNRLSLLFRPATCYQVKGIPWIEDLNRSPSSSLRISYRGAGIPLDEEQLYSLFRKYGAIKDISAPNPNEGVIQFSRIRDASTAKNCLHGFKAANGSILRITYIPSIQAHQVREYIMNHPRIVIPILIAILTTVAVTVFDPIRTFFIEQKITQSLSLSNSAVGKWVREKSHNSLQWIFNEKQGIFDWMNHWPDRLKIAQTIKQWIKDDVQTFIVVYGPRGTGKNELVLDMALKDTPNVLSIDCDTLVNTSSDGEYISNAAHQLGYYPVFPFLNSIAGIADLALTATIGQKSGFREPKETQLTYMLNQAIAAISNVALCKHKKVDNKAHNITSNESYLEAHPEDKPIIVLKNFLSKSSNNQQTYKVLSDWAAVLVNSNIARVIIITEDSTYAKPLTEALPERVFKQLSIEDAETETARNIVLINSGLLPAPGSSNSDEKPDDKVNNPEFIRQLDDAVRAVGGRMTDLQLLARRIKNGENPFKAESELIYQNATDIYKLYVSVQNKQRGWTGDQAWDLVKRLANQDSILSIELLQGGLFTESDGALASLEQAGFITTYSDKQRHVCIKPGKPIYKEAVKALVQDPLIYAKHEIQTNINTIATQTKQIGTIEEELRLLGLAPKQSYDLTSRINYLSKKLYDYQQAIEKEDATIAKMRKTINDEKSKTA